LSECNRENAKVFDQVEEKYPYYDFLKLHRMKEHGKAEEWDEWDGGFLWG
jgi:hypothetical protein